MREYFIHIKLYFITQTVQEQLPYCRYEHLTVRYDQQYEQFLLIRLHVFLMKWLVSTVILQSDFSLYTAATEKRFVDAASKRC